MLALAGQRARSFASNFLFAGEASKNYGGHEEAKSHNACAKNDNEECNKGCDKEMHSQILIGFTMAKKICSGIMSEARSAGRLTRARVKASTRQSRRRVLQSSTVAGSDEGRASVRTVRN